MRRVATKDDQIIEHKHSAVGRVFLLDDGVPSCRTPPPGMLATAQALVIIQ
jgi:hypothetical protein